MWRPLLPPGGQYAAGRGYLRAQIRRAFFLFSRVLRGGV